MPLEIKPLGADGTLQEYFDNAWIWAVVQKHPRAVNSNGHCQYKAPNGNCCLIGVSWQHLDTSVVENLCAPSAFKKLFGHVRHYELDELQFTHDSYEEREGDYHAYIEAKLRFFADKHKLTIPQEQA